MVLKLCKLWRVPTHLPHLNLGRHQTSSASGSQKRFAYLLDPVCEKRT